MTKELRNKESIEILERERERERAIFSQIGFVCNAQKQDNENIGIIRIGYEKEIKKFLLGYSLSFLCKLNI